MLDSQLIVHLLGFLLDLSQVLLLVIVSSTLLACLLLCFAFFIIAAMPFAIIGSLSVLSIIPLSGIILKLAFVGLLVLVFKLFDG